ncbi:PAS domain S-box protein [Isosphaeraceae bacterium EP7]
MRTTPSRASRLREYSIALIAAAVAIAATYATWPLLKPTPWAFCFAAVMVSAWFGGQGPSLVAMTMMAVAGQFLFLEPLGTLVPGINGLIPTLVFVGVSSFIGLLASARRKAVAHERAERRRFQATVTSIGDAVIATDDAGRVTFMNGVAQAMTGWSASEAAGRRLEDVFVIVNEGTREPVPNPVEKVLESGRIQGLANHTILIARDGSERPIDDSAAPIRDDRDEVAGVVLVFRDVTERREHDERAREAAERLGFALEVAGLGHWELDLIGGASSRTPRHDEIFGYETPHPNWTFETFLDHVLPEDRPGVAATFRAAVESSGSWDFECRVRRADGAVRVIAARGLARHDARGRAAKMLGIVEDITEAKLAESEMIRLREEERAADKRAERILESVTDAFFAIDRQWRFTYLNPRAGHQLQRDRDELLGKGIWEEFPDAIGTEFERQYRAAVDERRVATFEEYYPAPLNAWFEVHAYPSDEGLSVYFRNVNDRKRTEEELRAGERRLKFALKAGRMGTWDLDLGTGLLTCSDACRANYGRGPGETFRYEELAASVHEDDRQEWQRAVDDAIARAADFEIEYRVRWPDGSIHWVQVRASYSAGPGGEAPSMSGVSFDITDRKRAEEELRSKTERVNLLVENIRDYAVLIADAGGTIIEWQGGAERITGYAAAEAVGQMSHFLFTPEDRAEGVPEKELANAASAGRAEDKRWHLRKDGSRFFADGVMTPLYDEGGKLRGFGKVFKDATGEKQAAEATRMRAFQLQKLAEIASCINSAQDVNSVLEVVTGEARTLLGANQAATSMMLDASHPQPINVVSSSRKPPGGTTPPSIEGLEFYEAVGLANEPIRLTRAGLDADPRWRALGKLDDFLATANGWLAAPLVGRNGRSMGIIQLSDKEEGEFTADDEAILVQLAQLAAIAIENARLYQELRSNDESKDEFLAMLAHELRNPLAAIGNAVRLSSMSDAKEHVGWSMEVITRQMLHLSRLIDDLMDVSRITRGKIELRRDLMDATPILESAAATVGALVEERKHSLELDIDRGDVWVDVDPTRLEQVVVNLLNNAAKYSENGGHILLSARREGGEVVIGVKDRGVGILPDKLPAMFELFAQGDRSLARSEGGLGIGLTVVKKLVELHGGAIKASSEGPGRGSEFTIRLPAASRPTRTAPAPAGEARQGGGPSRILVVDDNVDTARGMARLLKIIGHDVAMAHTGPEAIEAARVHRPSVVLLDIGLPGMSGYEVAAQLRHEDACEGALIVAVSGYGQDEDRRRSKEAGFDHHLTKPLDHDVLLALISVGRA